MAFHRHGRFYLAGAGGAGVLALTWRLPLELRLLVASDAFFLGYLALIALLVRGLTPERLRERAAETDEGIVLIGAITALAVATNLGAIFVLLNRPPEEKGLATVAAVASVPLGWAMTHALAAFHYAHVYYGREPGSGAQAGGIDFPGTPVPGMSDFFYHAFVVGMTSQVADTAVTSRAMRRVVLIHAVAAFLYNTVLIALAVNAAIAFAQ